jgi:hypothetical protein
MSDRPGNRLACPHCLSPDYLFENATGWRGCTARMVDGHVLTDFTHGSRVEDAERVSFGCSNESCNYDVEIADHRLVQLGPDGKPVVEQPPEQERLA